MKKAYFPIAQSLSLILIILWVIFALNYFREIELNVALPVANNHIDPQALTTISHTIGFSTVPEMGKSFFVIAFILGVTYFFSMNWMFLLKVRRNVIFWSNIVVYSSVVALVVIGILFNTVAL